MDNKFLKQRLEKFDENVSLPNSLKAENLLLLIENITPDEPIAYTEKKVIWFDKKYMAVAAMFALAVGFVVFYRNTPKTDMIERNTHSQEERALLESAPEMSSDETEMFELYQDDEAEEEEYSQDEGLTGGGERNSAPQMKGFAAENYEANQSVDWSFSGDALYQNDKRIFEFPNDFTARDYYSYGDSLIFYGEKELDGKSSVYIFKKDDDGNFKITQSFRQDGSILEVYVFGDRAVAISVDGDRSNIDSYINSERKSSFRCNFAVDYHNIYLSAYGFAVTDGKQLAYAFDENGNLSSEIEIDKGKYFDGIEVEEKKISVFLSNGEMLDFPITK